MTPAYASPNLASPASNGSLCSAKQRSKQNTLLILTNPYLRLRGSNPCRWTLQDNDLSYFFLSFIVAVYVLGHTPCLVVASKPQWQFALRYVWGGRNIHGHSAIIRQVHLHSPLQTYNGAKNKPKTLTFSFVLNVHVAVR